MANLFRPVVWLAITLLAFSSAATAQIRRPEPGSLAILVFSKTTREYAPHSITGRVEFCDASGSAMHSPFTSFIPAGGVVVLEP